MFRDVAIRCYQGHILESSESWVRRTLFLGVRLFPKDSGIFPTHMRHGQKSRKLGKGKTGEGETIWKEFMGCNPWAVWGGRRGSA